MKRELSIYEANCIQRALKSKDGTADYETSYVDENINTIFEEAGLKFIGCKAEVRGKRPVFQNIFSIVDREIASNAILACRTPKSPILYKLTPHDCDATWVKHICPTCGGSEISFHGGDSVPVPVLPLGLESYGELDTFLSVGQCPCGQNLYVYEFGFSTLPYPDVPYPYGYEDVFVVGNIEHRRYARKTFKAFAKGMEPWFVSRLWFNSLAENKGPFIADFHQLGPFKIQHEDEIYEANNKWLEGSELFNNLAGEAMRHLKEFAASYYANK